MPSPFDITVASNTVNLDNKREGVATFTVKNNTRRRLHAAAKVSAQPADGVKWVTILPPADGSSVDARELPIDGTQQYQVKIAVPMDAAPASYTMKLTLADEINPDENFTVSPDVIFTVREIPKPEPRKLPSWLIPVVIVIILLIVVIIAGGVIATNNAANANSTGTAVALANARGTADALAAANAALTEQALAFAQETLTAQQAAFAQETVVAVQTQTALNVFVGSWTPVSSGVIDGIGISSTGNNQVTISYTSTCPPDRNLCFTTSRTYSFTNVPFSPTQLAAGGSALQLLIVPSNNNQILVTVQSGGQTSLQTFHRRSIRDEVLSQASLQVQSLNMNSAAIQHLLVATPGP